MAIYCKEPSRTFSEYLLVPGYTSEECIPANNTVEGTIESKELTSYINEWLTALPEQDAILFLRRYWFGDSVKDLAQKTNTTAAKMAQTMLRLRKSLKAYLEQKGVTL